MLLYQLDDKNMVSVDRRVLNIVQNNPDVMSFKELVMRAGFSEKTVRKAARRLHDNGLIDYPKRKKRGEKRLIKPIFNRKLVFSKFKSLRKFRKEVSKHTPIIFEWYNRDLEYIERLKSSEAIEIYATAWWKIDFRKKILTVLDMWFFNDVKGWEERRGYSDFSLKEIKAIHAPENISDFDEMLELWENPTLRITGGVICNWDGRKTSHSKECDSSLHETMRRLRGYALYSCRDEKDKKKAKNDVKKIVQFILKHGGKIPFTGL